MLRAPFTARFLVGIAMLAAGTASLMFFLDRSGGPDGFVLGIIYFFVPGFIAGFVINQWVALLLGALAFDLYVIWMSYPSEDWQALLPWNLLNGQTVVGGVVFWVMLLVAVGCAFGVKAHRAWVR